MSHATRISSRRVGSPSITLFAMCLTAGMTFLEITATIGTLTAIGNDLHVLPSTLVWVASSYTLPVAALILSASTLGSLYGRKRLLVCGVVVLALGSLTVATAQDVSLLLTGQGIAGLGAALILPNSIALITVTFTDPHRRTEAIGLWAAASGIGLAAGPVIAGVLLEHYSWHSVFLTNVVLGAVALAVTLPWVVESRQPGQRLDPAGLVLGTLAVSCGVFGIIEGGSRGYGDPRVVVSFAVAAVAAAAFVGVELRARDPMVDVRLFRSRSFSVVMVVSAVGLFGFTGVTLLVVLFFQRVLGLTQLATGLRLLPEMLAFILASAVTAKLVRKIGFTIPMVAGLSLSAAASIVMLSADATTYHLSLELSLALFGAGLGFVVAASTAAALTSVAPVHAAMASGLVNTFRQVGAVMGTAVLGTILTSGATSRLPAALTTSGVTGPLQDDIVLAFSKGTLNPRSLPAPARTALQNALTSGVHAGLIVNAGLFAIAALMAAALVRHQHLGGRPVSAQAPPVRTP